MKLNILVNYSLYLILFFPLFNHAQGINNGSGSTLVTEGNIAIVIENGGLKNDGTFVKSTSTVHFRGSNATAGSFIAGTGTTEFYHLTMNKSLNGIQLNTDIGVSGIVNFVSGDSIFLNNHNVNLGTTGSITGECAISRFTGLNGGYVTITQTLNAPNLANPGNIGIEITSASNLGSTTIKRSHGVFRNASIKRSFEIIPTNNTALDASFNFYYFLPELNGISEAQLSTFSSTNSGANWSYATNIVPNTTLHYITSNNISSFSMLTLFPSGIDLPVELIYFKGKPENKQALLNWATASETDNDRFEIERSAAGIHFTTIGSVKGMGNSSLVQTYGFIDSFPFSGTNYYRLKQIDVNKKMTYSQTIAVQFKNKTVNNIRLSPNPILSSTILQFVSDSEEQLQVQLIDVNGRIQKTIQLNSRKGSNKFTLQLDGLPKGFYTLTAVGKSNFSIQLIKH